MAGTLADGSSLSDYLKKARARQARGVFDETGAREAIERVRGREAEETGFQGQRVIGSNRGKFNPPKPPPPRKASTPPAKKPDAPKQMVAQMPKQKPAEDKLTPLIQKTQELLDRNKPTAPKPKKALEVAQKAPVKVADPTPAPTPKAAMSTKAPERAEPPRSAAPYSGEAAWGAILKNAKKSFLGSHPFYKYAGNR